MLNRCVEAQLLPYCQEHDVALLAYSPVAQGLLTGRIAPDREFPEGDFRRQHPRFSRENRVKAAALMQAIEPIAARHSVPLAHVAIAWTVAPGHATHSLVGARTPEQARESAAAADLVLSETEVAEINRQVEKNSPDVPHLLQGS